MNVDTKVYGWKDLASREIIDAGWQQPAVLAVLGNPVSHSASPWMHQPALAERGVNGRYVKIEVEQGRVREFFQRLMELGFTGCNVTVPHKFAAYEACDEVDAGAQGIGAVNTVKFIDGKMHGWSTDGRGFSLGLEEDTGFSVSGCRVLIVGAGGGAGQSIARQCALEHAQRVVLVNRSVEKVEKMAEELREEFPMTIFDVLRLDDKQLAGVSRQCHLLVNTSSLGLKMDDPSPLSQECFAAHHVVYDTIYQPPQTSFLRNAQLAGAKTANGFSMLLHQGVLAFEKWYGAPAPVEAMRAGLRVVAG